MPWLLVALPLATALVAGWVGWRWRGAVEARRQADAQRDRAARIAAEERRLREAAGEAQRVREGIEARVRAGDLVGALAQLGVRVAAGGATADVADREVSRVGDPAGPAGGGAGPEPAR